MKCQQVRESLLATSGNRQLPAEAVVHVEGCEVCRRWHDGLRDIDAAVPRLPVPNSGKAKIELIERLLSPATASAKPIWSKVRIGWPRAVLAVAAAIVLALGFAGVFNREHPHRASVAENVLLARIMDRNIALASAETVDARVKILADLAGDLDEQTRTLAYTAGGDDLNSLADLFKTVIQSDNGLLVRADELPAGDRKSVLEPIEKKLFEISKTADNLSNHNVPPGAIAPLRKIAATARDARAKMDRMVAANDGRIRVESLVQDAPPPRGKVKS